MDADSGGHTSGARCHTEERRSVPRPELAAQAQRPACPLLAPARPLRSQGPPDNPKPHPQRNGSSKGRYSVSARRLAAPATVVLGPRSCWRRLLGTRTYRRSPSGLLGVVASSGPSGNAGMTAEIARPASSSPRATDARKAPSASTATPGTTCRGRPCGARTGACGSSWGCPSGLRASNGAQVRISV